jgi:Rrf2 family protein
MISQTAEYALRAIVCLAREVSEPMPTERIARVTRVPPGYLSKVLQSLRRAGLVRARRGLGGGFTLARPPESIHLLAVVNAVDPIQRIRVCPLGLDSHADGLCALHRRLDEAMRLVEESFRATTVAELLAEAGREGMFDFVEQ